MDDNICEQCGTRNEPGAQFCVECQSFLPWDDTREAEVAAPSVAPAERASTQVADGPSNVTARPTEVRQPPPAPMQPTPDPAAEVTAVIPSSMIDAALITGGVRDAAPPGHRIPSDAGSGAEPVRVIVEPASVELVPGGDPESIEVQIYNLSPIVDAYRISAPQPPPWLSVTAAEVRLLPSSSERTPISLRIAPGLLVPAGRFRLLLQVRSVAHPEVVVSQYVDLTIPAVRTPLGLRLEPSVIRVKDAEVGQFQVVIDNTAGNLPRRVTLAGRDPEGLVRFFFAPAVVDVPPGGTVAAAVRIEAPVPDPGTSVNRQLTVSASDGEDDVTAGASLLQTASVEVPLVLRAEPSLLRVRDTATGQLDLTIDNRGGRRLRRVFLGGRDPERIVHFAFSPPSLDVLPGEVGRARLRVEAPPPPPGEEASRTLTVLATSEGAADLEVPVTFQQATSAAAVEAPITMRLDPSVVRVRDTTVGQLEAVVDNRGGTTLRRVFLSGRDPERLVRLTFSPPSLDVLPGEMGMARVRMEAPLPEPGQETTRQVTVIGADGGREIEAGGSFVQFTSPAPVETPVALKLEPSLIRARDTTSGQFQVIVDNRQGIRARRVTLIGSDPERAVGFSFWPPVVDVGRGEVARATGRIDAYPPEPGREVTRQFAVSASDGAKEVETAGTFIQSTSPPAPDEPMTLRLDPSVVRVRNSGSGALTVTADNRAGSRPRRVQFAGTDPERVVRFAFSPPVIDLQPGQSAAATVRVSAPRPDGGEQLTRPFTVMATDGARETEATGSFVQESADRRPLWRILLTVLGALMMIMGVVLPWNSGAALDIPSDLGAQVRPNITGLEWAPPAVDTASNDVLPDFSVQGGPDFLLRFASAGAVILLFAALVLLGLTGSSGRLTRISALVAAILLAAFMIAVAFQPFTGSPSVGVVLIFAGCAVAFAGGLFAKPRRS